MSEPTPPRALLLIAPGCPHCASVLEALGGLVKEAVLSRLEVVNIAADPEEARRLAVRSVPWTRIGELALPGLRTPGELREWARAGGTEAGLARYFDELLREGRRAEVEAMVRRDPGRLGALAELLVDPETGIHARLGVMATLEELAPEADLRGIVDRLGQAALAGETRIRVDALHALSLTGGAGAARYVEACVEDPDAEVRAAAHEVREALGRGTAPGAP